MRDGGGRPISLGCALPEGAKGDRLRREPHSHLWYPMWFFNLTSKGPIQVLLSTPTLHSVHVMLSILI